MTQRGNLAPQDAVECGSFETASLLPPSGSPFPVSSSPFFVCGIITGNSETGNGKRKKAELAHSKEVDHNRAVSTGLPHPAAENESGI